MQSNQQESKEYHVLKMTYAKQRIMVLQTCPPKVVPWCHAYNQNVSTDETQVFTKYHKRVKRKILQAKVLNRIL